MSYMIKGKNWLFVDFRKGGTPEWSPDKEDARRFVTKEQAIAVRDELRALGQNPKIVSGGIGEKKQPVTKTHTTIKGNTLGMLSLDDNVPFCPR